MEPVGVVDLFCGAGGLSEGFRAAGARILAGTDHDPDACAIPHPRLVRRRFAMAGPLAVDPGVPLPDGGPLADAFAAIDAASQPVRRLPATEASLH